MTLENTNTLKNEIKRLINEIGFTFMDTRWLNNLSTESKSTLKEYCYDMPSYSKRDIALLLYHDKDEKIWEIIMEGI